ncbi:MULTISPECIES: lipid-binding protein [unclassified Flavobacterium]|uniref:lipid-binding protein n=1 Tax=unclassified Flavobacterium TaxID=196869 RepID=UPI001F135B74|nr:MULTISPECIES: lipid-binding protein [unclassified Flavobacterium]UMY66966.1 hypothetical protein MKO97_06185 [Flavobacterium sp. HJ-32-4]
MKRFKFTILTMALATFGLTVAVSCDEGGNPDAGGTKTKNFAGDWHIVGYEPDGVTPAFGGGYVLYSTYNASSNDENFWIDDHDEFFEIKTKVQATDFTNLTFSGQPGADELYAGGTVHVTNGKIFKNGGTSFGGHVVDSIYFEAEFDWDPGTVYKFGGHKRTGFLEDEL